MRGRFPIRLAALLLIGAAVFLAGLTWGLPSRAADPYLFGDRTPWTGQQILHLVPTADTNVPAAADVDLNPIQHRDQPVHLNATDAQRAEIVRRYRLYSHQPDEMNTFMALASMNPASGDLDPKMYKYGGMWIYPVAALLKAGSLAGVVTLRGDLAYYLDHPEAFARFYVVARLYAVFWGLLGVAAVWMIARRLTDRPWAPVLAALLFIFMPIVVIQAHEAKPHLPGTVLILLTILAAHRYTRDGRLIYAVIAGGLCGAAVGMVLSAWPVAVVLPIAILLTKATPRQRGAHLLAAGGKAAAVFIATNPYLLINLFINRPLLKSHFENSAAFYDVGDPIGSLIHAARLVMDGASPAVAVAGLIVVVIWMMRYGKGISTPHQRMASLLLAPATIVAMQFIAVAAHQPADFALLCWWMWDSPSPLDAALRRFSHGSAGLGRLGSWWDSPPFTVCFAWRPLLAMQRLPPPGWPQPSKSAGFPAAASSTSTPSRRRSACRRSICGDGRSFCNRPTPRSIIRSMNRTQPSCFVCTIPPRRRTGRHPRRSSGTWPATGWSGGPPAPDTPPSRRNGSQVSPDAVRNLQGARARTKLAGPPTTPSHVVVVL